MKGKRCNNCSLCGVVNGSIVVQGRERIGDHWISSVIEIEMASQKV
jgi:hypothetical protein